MLRPYKAAATVIAQVRRKTNLRDFGGIAEKGRSMLRPYGVAATVISQVWRKPNLHDFGGIAEKGRSMLRPYVRQKTGTWCRWGHGSKRMKSR